MSDIEPDIHSAMLQIQKLTSENQKLQTKVDELKAINEVVSNNDVCALLKLIEVELNDVKAKAIKEMCVKLHKVGRFGLTYEQMNDYAKELEKDDE